ncbi:hypothetical protein [Streptomyces sp. NPDC018000]|uniref:hypothetical protein n=1 Tax=Streptomyces sp. NPDC018000 TaxID=3365028 RepID=UPI0037BD64A9
MTTLVFSSLKQRPLGFSQSSSRDLTRFASSDEVVGVPHQHRSTGRRAGLASRPDHLVLAPGGLFHPVESDVQQRADHTALRSSLLGRCEPAAVDHTGLQPAPDQVPGGELSDGGSQVVVVDAVERRRQVRVQHPQTLRGLALHVQKIAPIAS